MSSRKSRLVGPGEILAYLRADFQRSPKSLLIVGPWLDDWFADQVSRMIPSPEVQARALVRPENEVDALAWERTLAALSVFASSWASFETRSLSRLHAKCICIDNEIVYLGSTNWYRYSVETSVEITLRIETSSLEGGIAEIESLWDQGEQERVTATRSAGQQRVSEGITEEVLDPLAAQALRDNPKAFVLGKRKRKR